MLIDLLPLFKVWSFIPLNVFLVMDTSLLKKHPTLTTIRKNEAIIDNALARGINT